eukprot:3328-Rhodomonas_salina.2
MAIPTYWQRAIVDGLELLTTGLLPGPLTIAYAYLCYAYMKAIRVLKAGYGGTRASAQVDSRAGDAESPVCDAP